LETIGYGFLIFAFNKVVGGLATSLGFRVIYLAKMVSDSFKKTPKKKCKPWQS